MIFRLTQFIKTPGPIEVTEFGIVTLVKFLQPQKTYFPIDVTEFGTVTLVKLTQF